MPLGRILDQLVSLQKLIEPQKVMNVVKNFVFIKKLPTTMSGAIQCMSHVRAYPSRDRGQSLYLDSLGQPIIPLEEDPQQGQQQPQQLLQLQQQGGGEDNLKEEDLIWCGCGDGSLWIFDALTEGLRYSKAAHAKRVVCIFAIPEVGQVWTSSIDQTIKIWKARVKNSLTLFSQK